MTGMGGQYHRNIQQKLIYQEIPEWILEETVTRLPQDIKAVLKRFYQEVKYDYPKIAEAVLKLT